MDWAPFLHSLFFLCGGAENISCTSPAPMKPFPLSWDCWVPSPPGRSGGTVWEVGFPNPECQTRDAMTRLLPLFPSIQPSVSHLCQGFLSLMSGFLCSQGFFWWLHPAYVTQALSNRANPVKWCRPRHPDPHCTSCAGAHPTGGASVSAPASF